MSNDSSWRKNETEVLLSDEQRLAVSKIFEAYHAEGAIIWLFSPHPVLDGVRPAQAILDGRSDEVAHLIEMIT